MFFQKKTPKTQAPDKTPYTLYNPNDEGWNEEAWKGRIRVISIDPGRLNYCIRVEERPYRVEICQNYEIETLLYDKLKLTNDEIDLDENYQSAHYNSLIKYLDAHLELFRTCHLLIIERQLPFQYKVLRIAQHTITYMMLNCRNLETSFLIFEVDSKLKSRALKASNLLNDRGVKKWAIDHALELLKFRQDTTSLNIINRSKKKDDYADTVCQIEALFTYMQWPVTSYLAEYKRPLKLNIIE